MIGPLGSPGENAAKVGTILPLSYQSLYSRVFIVRKTFVWTIESARSINYFFTQSWLSLQEELSSISKIVQVKIPVTNIKSTKYSWEEHTAQFVYLADRVCLTRNRVRICLHALLSVFSTRSQAVVKLLAATLFHWNVTKCAILSMFVGNRAYVSCLVE